MIKLPVIVTIGRVKTKSEDGRIWSLLEIIKNVIVCISGGEGKESV